jgi:uncharacterized membrane protein
MTGSVFLRIVEITFTSFMVPTLLVPVVWVAGLLLKGRMRTDEEPAGELNRQWWILLCLFLLWLLLLLAVVARIPLNLGGSAAIVLCWALYVSTNLLLAWYFLRFTARYGSIPAGAQADRVFLRFISIVVTQPLMTAAAFAVLNVVMGLAWNERFPDLPVIQEGI